MFRNLLKRKEGQGLTEYLLLIGAIVLVAALALGAFGEQIKAAFESLTETLSNMFGGKG